MDLEQFIVVFHRWVAEQSVDELLIDVADYRHVPNGPGVVLVGHEADYAMDNTGGRWGLVYNRKAPVDGSNGDRFGQAVRSAAIACQTLESAFSSEPTLKFRRDEFALIINDRALAPNTAATLAAMKPELENYLKRVLGHDDFSLDHNDNPRDRFGVAVKMNKPFDLAALAGTAS